ncbi:hypothetical protein GH722_17660 [Alphaproteobacteria bacterium HT1-32]|nr:hypothetical protein [Alphaproteobacteria bacterium HT1-32]
MAQASDDEGIQYDGRRVVDLSPAEEDWADDAPGPRRSGAGKAVLLLLAAFVLVGAGMGAGWLIYSNQSGTGTGGAPLVRAPAEPAKVRPENPGGMEVPDTDKGVYDVVSGNAGEPRTEKLLDAPERPQVPQASHADATTGQPLDITKPAPPAEPVAAPPPSAVAAPAAPAPDSSEAPAPEPAPLAKVEPAPAPAEAVAPTEKPAPAPKPEAKKPIQLTKAPATSAEPKKPEPAKTAPSSGSWRIQVGALRDEAAAEKEFARLQRRHPDLLGNLGLSIMKVDITGKGSFYRMRAGPLADSAAASALCGQLKAAKVPCLTVRPGS